MNRYKNELLLQKLPRNLLQPQNLPTSRLRNTLEKLQPPSLIFNLQQKLPLAQLPLHLQRKPNRTKHPKPHQTPYLPRTNQIQCQTGI